MTPYTIADGCCGAGMAADGYALAGLEPHGLDLFDQPLYPYTFERRDVLEWLASDEPDAFDALHLSFPCQVDTRAGALRRAQGGESRFPDVLTPGLALLRERWSHKVWVVENVEGARRRMTPALGETLARLCGSSFWLGVQRHRLFLSNVPLRSSVCHHERFEPDPLTGKPRPWGVYHVPGDSIPSGGRTARDAEHGRAVMGVDRPLPWDALKEGFPSHYTAHVGADVVRALEARRWGAAALYGGRLSA